MSIRKIVVLLIAVVVLLNVIGVAGISTMANSAAVDAYKVMQVDKNTSENLVSNWGHFGGGYKTVSMKNHTGQTGNVYKMESFGSTDAGMSHTINNPTLGTYTFSGYSKAENVKRNTATEYYSYAMVAMISYQDGTAKDFHTQFEYGTHDWEYQEFSFTIYKPAKHVTLYVFLRPPALGTAYFDDLRVTLQPSGTDKGVFDDVPVTVLKKGSNQETEATLKTQDGLELGLGATQVTSLKVDGKELKNDAFSGFMVRDIASAPDKDGVYSFATKGSSAADKFVGNQPTLGLDLKANFTAEDDCIKVSGVITEEKDSDDGRAVQLSYALPITATGWKMGYNLLDSDVIESGSHAEYKPVGDGTLSIVDWDTAPRTYYPTACIYNEELGIAIAASMEYPSYWQLEYNGSTGQYAITYQLGIVKEAPESAKFDFVIYKLDDPAYGFRSAWKKYTTIYPEQFEVRQKDQGVWVAWSSLDHLIDVEDFNLKFREIGSPVRSGSIFEVSNNIKGVFYFELGDWWLSNLAADDHEAVWERIREVAKGKTTQSDYDKQKAARQAIATEFCKVLDQNGKIAWNPVNVAWSPNGAQVHINANPALPGEFNFLTCWYDSEIREMLFNPMKAQGGIFDGIYLDEFSGWWLGNANFNKEHYQYTTVPLTYSPYFKRPILHRASTTWECAKYISDDMRSLNKIVFSNKNPDKNAWNTTVVDAMGTEQTALQGSVYVPQTIRQLSTWRTLAYQKSFSILFNNDYNLLTTERMEDYFNRCLVYGIFPSPMMHNDTVNGTGESYYWKGAEQFYERDRWIFQTYMPILKEMAESGWEPVTNATVNDPEIIVERYGDNDAEGYHIALFNPTASAVDVQVNLDMTKFTLDEGCTFMKYLENKAFTLENNTVTVHLEPERSEVLVIRDPNKIQTGDGDDGQGGTGGGTVGGGSSSNGGSGNNNSSNDGNSQSQGAMNVGGSHTITTDEADLFKTIKHHLTNYHNNHINKKTLPWTITLIVVDALAAAFGVTTFLLWRKKKKGTL